MEPTAAASPPPAEGAAAPGPVPPIVHRSRRARPGYRLAGIALLILVIAVAGWGLGYYPPYYGSPGASSGACGSGALLEGEGASLLSPLLSVWGPGFSAAYAGEQVDYSPLGTGSGITALTERTVDFAATDEPLTSAEYAALPGTVMTLPVAAAAIALVYDLPGVTGPLALDGSVLAGIYLGAITHWNDPAIQALNPSLALPSATILTAHRSDAAGTTAILTAYLAAASPAWATGPGVGIQPSWPPGPAQRGIQGNSGLLHYVKATAYSIGYADLPDVLGAGGLSDAAMENPSGHFVQPDLTDTASAVADRIAAAPLPPASASWSNVSFVNAPGATDYPLVAMAYFLVYQSADLVVSEAGVAVALHNWLTWVTGPGQSDESPLAYAALPPALASATGPALGTISYAGSPLPVCPTTGVRSG
jgi:phosphate transport system substrate-binding protein